MAEQPSGRARVALLAAAGIVVAAGSLALVAVLAVRWAGAGGDHRSRCEAGTGSRHDVAGISRRLRLPRVPTAAVWAVVPLGALDGRAPGPTDSQLVAVLTFAEADAPAVAAALAAPTFDGGDVPGTLLVPSCLNGVPAEVAGRLRPTQDDDWLEAGGRVARADLGAGEYAAPASAGSVLLLDGGRHVVVVLRTS